MAVAVWVGVSVMVGVKVMVGVRVWVAVRVGTGVSEGAGAAVAESTARVVALGGGVVACNGKAVHPPMTSPANTTKIKNKELVFRIIILSF